MKFGNPVFSLKNFVNADSTLINEESNACELTVFKKKVFSKWIIIEMEIVQSMNIKRFSPQNALWLRYQFFVYNLRQTGLLMVRNSDVLIK